jgi:hypothetical protein
MIKFRQVRSIIKNYTGKYPSQKLAVEAMIDEFLNLHVGAEWERELMEEEDGCSRSIGIENSNSTVLL